MSQRNIISLTFAICAIAAGASAAPASVFAAEGNTPATSGEITRASAVSPKTAADLENLQVKIATYPGFSTVHLMILNIKYLEAPAPIITARITDVLAAEGDTTDYSAWETMPVYKMFEAAKSVPLYSTNTKVKTTVDDEYKQVMDAELPDIIAGLEFLFPSESTDYSQMSAGELIAKARTYPGFDKYENLVAVYGELVAASSSNAPAMTDEERGVLYDRAYQALIAAFPTIGDDGLFAPTNTTPAKATPTAPNTGSNQDLELSATIVTVALTAIASVAVLSGAVVIAKNYFFSPLKRRK